MIQNIRRSLTDLLGAEYTAAVGPPPPAHPPAHPQTQPPRGPGERPW